MSTWPAHASVPPDGPSESGSTVRMAQKSASRLNNREIETAGIRSVGSRYQVKKAAHTNRLNAAAIVAKRVTPPTPGREKNSKTEVVHEQL